MTQKFLKPGILLPATSISGGQGKAWLSLPCVATPQVAARRLRGVLLLLLLFFCFSNGAFAQDYGLKVNGKTVKAGSKGTGWVGNALSLQFTADRMPKDKSKRRYTITGKAARSVSISIGKNVVDSEFTLEDVTLDNGTIFFQYDGGVSQSNTIVLRGTNVINGANRTCIDIGPGSTVYVRSSSGDNGKLILKANPRGPEGSPAICSYDAGASGANGKLIIQSGDIEAYGTLRCAAIGNTYSNSDRGFFTVIVEGGKLKAVGGDEAPGIGSCIRGFIVPSVQIKGGTVESVGGSKSSIDFGAAQVNRTGTARAIITGGSFKTSRCQQVDIVNASNQPLYRVEVPIPRQVIDEAQKSRSSWTVSYGVRLSDLPGYGYNSMYYDNDGKVYLWLPNGRHEFGAQIWETISGMPFYSYENRASTEWKAEVNNSFTTAKMVGAFKPSIDDMTIAKGNSYEIAENIKPKNVPADYKGTVTYTSSYSGVVSISDGKINAVETGTATITATFPPDDNYKTSTATFNVTVKAVIVAVDGTNLIQNEEQAGNGWKYSYEVHPFFMCSDNGLQFFDSQFHTVSGLYEDMLPMEMKSGSKAVFDKLTITRALVKVDEGEATLNLRGNSHLESIYFNMTPVEVGEGATLTIDQAAGSTGATLTLYGARNGQTDDKSDGKDGGAGLGSSRSMACGNINIKGGIIRATGRDGGSGIGGGYGSTCGTITISGGTVVASHDGDGYDIGAGKDAAAATVRIIGGSVKATTFNGEPVNASSQRVYRVTVGGLKPNQPVTVSDLNPGYAYGTKDIYADEDGKIYLWLPNGVHGLKVNGTAYDAAVNNADGVLMLHHDGTAADPYLISNSAEWDCFAAIVNSVKNNAWGRMTANVGAVKTMVGTESKPYTGTFDGQGFLLMVDYSNGGRAAAPFSYVGNATVKNVFTDGTIQYQGQYAGGIVGLIVNNNTATITGCGSSATIKCVNTTGDTSTGGLVGGGVVTMRDCIFNGTLQGSGSCRSGLMGWANAGTTLTNCLQLGSFSVDASSSATFARGNANIQNCYYKTALGSAQGVQATDAQLASGEIAWKLQGNATTQAWGQNIGVDANPILTSNGDLRVRKASFTIEGNEVGTTYAVKAGNFIAPDIDVDYETTDPDDFEGLTVDKDITVKILLFNKDKDNFSVINNLDDWNNFAAYYNSEGNYRLGANIDGVTTMAGTADKPFKGVFDGQNYTLNVNITDNGPFVAPFRYVAGATFRNLHVTGTEHMTGSDFKHCSGLLGRTDGAKIERCTSSVALTFDNAGDAYSGGLVGHAGTSTITISDCAFTGSFTSAKGGTPSVGGLIGWGEKTCKADIKNSYVDLTLSGITGFNNLVRAFDGWSPSGSSFSNCFYTVPDGVTRNFDPEDATLVTAAQMQSGFVANLLQKAHGDDMTWGQTLTGSPVDARPVLTGEASKRVFKAAFNFEGSEVAATFANAGKNFGRPTIAYKQADPANFDQQPASQDVSVNLSLFSKDGDFSVIADLTDWNNFAAYATAGKYRLKNDISGITTPAAPKQRPFTGTFDGQNHTLNVNFDFNGQSNDVQDDAAPFRVLNGATIVNLRTAGTITTSKTTSDAAGIVGEVNGSTSISHSQSSVAITYYGTGDATNGGLVGRVNKNSSLKVDNCAFFGSLKSDKGHSFGGFVGWTDGGVTISNSLVVADINVQSSGNNTGNAPFSRNAGGTTVTNCFYRDFSNILEGYRKGTVVTNDQLASGVVAHDLQIAQQDMHWGQLVGTDRLPQLTTDTGLQVFRVDIKYDQDQSLLSTQFINRGKTATKLPFSAIKPKLPNYDASWYYKLSYGGFDFATKIDKDYTVPVSFAAQKKLEIASADDWKTFADAVADGQNYITAELKNDVEGATAMVGTAQYPYCGTFEGNYHTLMVDLQSDEQFCAPFRQVRHADINRLKTLGTVTSSNIHASGLVGRGDYVHIHNCEVGVDIRFNRSGTVHSGGFVGHGADDEVYIDKCAFNGTFSSVGGQSFNGVAGFLGWGGKQVTFKNSYVHYPMGSGCQGYFPFIYRSSGVESVTITDCFAADYGAGANYDSNNVPCTKVNRQQVESGYATYTMQKRIPVEETQVEPVWGQRIGTDMEPHVVGNVSDMKVIRNIFSATDSLYANHFIIDENKNSLYNMEANGFYFDNTNLMLKRKFTDGWNTLVLPISVSYDELMTMFGPDTKVAEFSNDDPGVITFNSVTSGSIFENEPFLIKTQTTDSVFTFGGRIISATEEPMKYGNNEILFLGTYDELHTVQAGDFYFNGLGLCQSDGTTKLKATRGYFRVPDSEKGDNIHFVIDGEDVVTGIDDVTRGNGNAKVYRGVYTLSGQKVADTLSEARLAHLQPGVYIVDGKKMVIK